jgi:hypothetical protein
MKNGMKMTLIMAPKKCKQKKKEEEEDTSGSEAMQAICHLQVPGSINKKFMKCSKV